MTWPIAFNPSSSLMASILPQFRGSRQSRKCERFWTLPKKMVGPVAKREAVAHLQAVMGLSERRACGIVGADRKMVRYRSCRPPDTELRGHLRELANARRRVGSPPPVVRLSPRGGAARRARGYPFF